MPKTICNVLARLLFLMILSVGLVSSPFTVQVIAQEDNSVGIRSDETLAQPKERVVRVTASVNDTTSPTVPILISPTNDSHLSTSTPTFVWNGSTDAFEISHYIMTLDGSTVFATIPITATDNAQFTLTYDSLTHYYSLTPKSSIADGTHTWKITAVDSYDNTASSVTWTFSIDTQSPVFVITELDGAEQSISAQDTSTVPTDPIELTNNEPILSGTGEAGSTVELTVTLEDGSTTSYSFEISSDGTWEVQLGILPRDQVVYLDFRITDQVGHISVIEDLPLILKTAKIVIPSIPFLPTPDEPLEIPLPPPLKELIPEIIKDVVPPNMGKMMALFPAITATPREVGQFSTTSILVLLLVLTLPTLKTIILATRFGSDFGLNSLGEIWRVIGLIPGRKPQGIVVYENNQNPVSFAKVIISGKLTDYHRVTTTRLTNKEGIYAPSNLQNGAYQLDVIHPTTLFPTLAKKRSYLNWTQYYQGQEFTVDRQHQEPYLVVPVDEVETKSTWGKQIQWWLLTRQMANLPLLATSILITLFASSYINIGATLFYSGCIVVLRTYFWQHKIKGETITIERTPLTQVIIMAFNAPANSLLNITQSDQAGHFTTRVRDEKLRLLATDFGFELKNVAKTNDKSTNTLVVENSGSKSAHPILILEAAQ